MLTRFFRLRRGQKGFTLIELLVVVAIVALLTAFAIPSLYGAMNKARASKDKVTLDAIAGAAEQFFLDKGYYPTTDASHTSVEALPPTTTTSANGYFEDLLKNQYLKTNAKLKNFSNHRFLYITNGVPTGGSSPYVATADGSKGVKGEWYILVDSGNYAAVKVTCGTASYYFKTDATETDARGHLKFVVLTPSEAQFTAGTEPFPLDQLKAGSCTALGSSKAITADKAALVAGTDTAVEADFKTELPLFINF